jgi:hypothetical protein
MKIHVISTMHNEATILPYFLRHYGSFAERIFVYEDRSTDGTRQLLEGHPKVTVFDCERHGINEHYWINEVWPSYEQHSQDADWVMCVDADEFIYHPALLRVLAAEKEKRTQLIHCKGYTMLASQPPVGDGQIYDEIQLGVPDRWSGKWACFSPDIRLRYDIGRHKVKQHSAERASHHSGIRILHYRWLGQQYFEQRDMRNTESYSAADGRDRKYDPAKRHNLPDSTRGIPLEWYPANMDRAINCVELP